ncbi:MAG: AI-2E family transporter [Candidatus Thiodiazotropha sp. (ex Lucinoma aequizonata)]|nr:AI-2E family transporter [Candidatus Thiodiazotropha sp. (ex Lucinoma aequizonata)]MCU7888402.1 AI-2E family transporter [Candidatus Thiodiazotropha sp. (ex Lucinoma aequizonata)]MCU7894238.1 AI-2E family transporter [Candidatus Thiodiazotropha sp. (ex Lucinoma aequizonata)]MCU7898742.1 AI-2E family transporter [Candidatus Thiodiazotropha sp. (ex Lucinoma aequizonata)]MCU7901684.1 AI-2E family transporter [Candidatus Thiodiazotropha sp. (ex Lucinoma aequizonata)]
MQVITNWFKRYFSDPQIVFLTLFLLFFFSVVITMGHMLAPVLASIVVAYLLEGIVSQLERNSWPRSLSVILVFILFLLFVALVLLGLLPLLSRQVSEFLQQLPIMISMGQNALMQLPERYPDLIPQDQVDQLIQQIRNEIASFAQQAVSWSLASVVGVITLVVYLILMPLLVFFFLKDKRLIIDWFVMYLPRHRRFAGTVWKDVDKQIANYVRGKFWEIVTVWAVSFIAFRLLGLNYALLLAVMVGLSVIIPYIGAAVVTIPILFIAWFQWGWTTDFAWLAAAYFIIQALDGNVLVPLLFSEVVNLHPVAIIVAILVFGGFWGFWGVFFAIPLATLVQAVLSAWPKNKEESSDSEG